MPTADPVAAKVAGPLFFNQSRVDKNFILAIICFFNKDYLLMCVEDVFNVINFGYKFLGTEARSSCTLYPEGTAASKLIFLKIQLLRFFKSKGSVCKKTFCFFLRVPSSCLPSVDIYFVPANNFFN